MAGGVVAAFVMAALIIALTNAPTFKVRPDRYQTVTDSFLVELEVTELHAKGQIEVPGVGKVEEPSLFVWHEGRYYTAPRIYAGCWELKLSEEHADRLAGIFGRTRNHDFHYWYTGSPGEPYDDTPLRLLGRQNGRVIAVKAIADCYGYYRTHLVTSWADLPMLGLCGLVACSMAGVWCLFRPSTRAVFYCRALISLCLIILSASILVSFGVAVHAEETPFWAGPLAAVSAVAGWVYAVRRLRLLS